MLSSRSGAVAQWHEASWALRYVTPPLLVNQTQLEYPQLVVQQQVPAQWPLLAAVPQEPAQPVTAR